MGETGFARVWSEASRVRGWFSKGEARTLFEFALGVPPGRCIVEVGSYCGRSTVVLARSGRPVHAVDPMIPGTVPAGRWEITPAHVEELERVLARHPNVAWHRAPSADAPLPEEPVGLLLVDGEHAWPQPMRDFERFEPITVQVLEGR
jgi:hypothetical protein